MPRQQNVSEWISGGGISPSGKRAVFAARGDIFTVPASDGEIRNLTRTPGIREREPTWSPDGSRIAYLSDRSGEYELYVRAQDGSGDEERITTDGDTWRFAPEWSPDNTKLAFGDTRERLRYADLESGKVVDVDTGRFAPITTYVWSPDSRWIAYTKTDEAQFDSIWVYSVDDGTRHQLTGDFTNDYSPGFDPKGRYLYFLSDRDWNLSFSGYEFNYVYADPTRVYAALLQADGPALFRPKSDEEEPADSDEEDNGGSDDGENGEEEEEEELRVEIDFDGFDHRVVALPGDSGNYASVQAVEDGVLFVHIGDDGSQVRMFSIESEEIETIIPDVGNYAVSADGKKLLYNSGDDFGIVPVKADQESGSGSLDLSGMTMRIEPMAEWQQIFREGWRISRDWFYDDGMHGLDWQGVHDLYAPLVPHVAHRGDLDYILGEMGGELSAGHFYVNWGDMPSPERVDNGLLGAEIVAGKSGYFKIDKIFPGENWHQSFRSPLTEPGVDVQEGDWILAVDGRSTKEVDNFYELLEAAAGRTVVLRVNDKPKDDGARDVSVRPIARETNLRYLDWTKSRLERVEALSNGRIGYVHLPDTAFAGNRELRKNFYPQAHKDALIFDARYNGGGFIPDRMIELLDFKKFEAHLRRNVETLKRMYNMEFDTDAEVSNYRELLPKILPYIKDTSHYLNAALKEGKNILMEGANGTLLDIDHGTYPFVTSSNASIGGICTGTGVSANKLTSVLGAMKAYSTRVGAGPFPTELENELGEKIRTSGSEFGSTTGRPRRCGWFDAVASKYSVMINGFTSINLTKLDVLDDLETLKIATKYIHNGKPLESFPSTEEILSELEVEYIEMPGWKSDTSAARKIAELPENAR
ncbi:MAG: adenylosuccinate synthetase, partial [Acidobacteria bacterium]|nr:adenylosuccinate synthetase [Acidobacteriota bacterium]